MHYYSLLVGINEVQNNEKNKMNTQKILRSDSERLRFGVRKKCVNPGALACIHYVTDKMNILLEENKHLEKKKLKLELELINTQKENKKLRRKTVKETTESRSFKPSGKSSEDCNESHSCCSFC